MYVFGVDLLNHTQLNSKHYGALCPMAEVLGWIKGE